jgi:dTMP kinase
MTPPNRFFVLEGIDGAGTTTQLGHLALHLRRQGHTVVETCEPSGGPVGRACRTALGDGSDLDETTLALMFAADRADHNHRVIGPALKAGHVVLCDRYVMSSLAYQGLHLPLSFLRAINQQAQAPLAHVWLDVPIAVARQRVHARGGPTERYDTGGIQARVDAAYRSLAQHKDAALGPIYTLDGAAPMAQVTARLTALVDNLLRAQAH